MGELSKKYIINWMVVEVKRTFKETGKAITESFVDLYLNHINQDDAKGNDK